MAIESTHQIHRGFWGTVAAGGVFASMIHLEGRRAPHAEARSRELLKANRGEIGEAEMLVSLFNGALEIGHGPDSPVLRRRLHEFAWTHRAPRAASSTPA